MSKNIREININQIKIHDPFWSAMQHRMTDTVIPFQEKVLNSHEFFLLFFYLHTDSAVIESACRFSSC